MSKVDVNSKYFKDLMKAIEESDSVLIVTGRLVSDDGEKREVSTHGFINGSGRLLSETLASLLREREGFATIVRDAAELAQQRSVNTKVEESSEEDSSLFISNKIHPDAEFKYEG